MLCALKAKIKNMGNAGRNGGEYYISKISAANTGLIGNDEWLEPSVLQLFQSLAYPWQYQSLFGSRETTFF